jgi:hypothetical protein
MPSKSASTRVTNKVAGKSVSAAPARPAANKARVSRLEAKRLESFKTLMAKYRGKATFAGFDA